MGKFVCLTCNRFLTERSKDPRAQVGIVFLSFPRPHFPTSSRSNPYLYLPSSPLISRPRLPFMLTSEVGTCLIRHVHMHPGRAHDMVYLLAAAKWRATTRGSNAGIEVAMGVSAEMKIAS